MQSLGLIAGIIEATRNDQTIQINHVTSPLIDQKKIRLSLFEWSDAYKFKIKKGPQNCWGCLTLHDQKDFH